MFCLINQSDLSMSRAQGHGNLNLGSLTSVATPSVLLVAS